MSHLTEAQLEAFRQRLLDAKASVEALLAQTAADAKPVDLELPIGRLTRIDAIQMQGMAQMNRNQLEIRLQQIEASLQSFRRGLYGMCRHCKQPVHLERLKVLPESPFCVDCQERFEQERAAARR